MKIAFFDPIEWDYSPASPKEKPLGGSQSGLCYLSSELAKSGHEVVLVNQIQYPGVYEGVYCPGMDTGGNSEFLNRFDVVVVLNGPIGITLRDWGVKSRMILWCQHDVDQQTVQNLNHSAERQAWDGYALVSDWFLKRYHSTFGIPRKKMKIMRNAIAPMFENVPDREPFFRRGDGPVLVYSSTPFRGLGILLMAFPMIHAAIPDCRLKVYSSMGVYQMFGEQDQYHVLYELCRSIEGSEYIGSISQTELATAFLDTDIMAYPNTFPEGACIAVMEAMASDCLIATSDLGALPETTAGYGFLSEVKKNILGHAASYAQMVIGIINDAYAAPDEFEKRLAEQKAFTNTTYSWGSRSREWEEWLLKMML